MKEFAAEKEEVSAKGTTIVKENNKKYLLAGTVLLLLFGIWTYMIQNIDVKPVGVNGSDIGFATINTWFHNLTGVHMWIYTMTDWLGLVPIFICMVFAGLGFVQLIKRRSLLKVNADILILGVYYILVIFGYLIFEMIPINYRPILIDGFMEASYPSSTTLLVLSVMPTLIFQVNRRMTGGTLRRIINILAYVFAILMVFGRLVAGVHWLTDIVGSVFLSLGLYFVYRGIVSFVDSCLKKDM